MVREIRIYVEGGGDSKAQRSLIRAGFGQFLGSLKQLARAQHIRWNIIACGPRNEAFADFKVALRTHPEAFNVLLVDAEEPVSGSPWKHLKSRDGWESPGVPDEHCHFMVEAVEAWLVADPDTLAEFYGQGFRRNALPSRQDVEANDKESLSTALKRATEATQKGPYHKINHCPKILEKVDPARVRARAKYCDRLFETLSSHLKS